MIKGMNHVSASAVTFDRWIRLYREFMEMQILVEETAFGGELYEVSLRSRAREGKSVFAEKTKLGLELFEFSHLSPRPKDPNYHVSDYCLSQLPIEVVDIESV